MQQMSKTISNYLVGTIIWCLILTLLFSCNTLKKAYDKVALDAYMPKVENKEKLIPYFNLNFPTKEKTIIKDSLITKVIESKVYDTITEIKNNEIYKYIYNTDTLVFEKVRTVKITVLDTLGNYQRAALYNAANDSLKAYKAKYLDASKLVSELSKPKTIGYHFAEGGKMFLKAYWWLILLVAAAIIYNPLKLLKWLPKIK